MPDFIGDVEEVTHSGSCANCRFGRSLKLLVICSHPQRIVHETNTDGTVKCPIMHAASVCELWEGKE